VFQTEAHQASTGQDPSGGFAVGFAEPDWQGDGDFTGAVEPIDLDSLLASLADQIDVGVREHWLDAYYARRASFDLQSIRCQIDRDRRRQGGAILDEDLRAILSRADRLNRFLRAARSLES
jgi:hypothetical protein